MKQKIRQQMTTTKSTISVFIFTLCLFLTPVLAFADPRSDAEKKLKTDGAAVINSFTNIFQYLGYIVAGLALIMIFVGSFLIHDEEAYRKAKRIGTITIVLAVLVGFASTLITIATNK